MYKTRRALLIAGVSSLMFLGLAMKPARTQTEAISRVEPQQALQLAPFTAIELDGGAKAVLNYGPAQRVTLLKGNPDLTHITVTGERLIIDKCRDKCPRGYEVEVEIVTPLISAVAVRNGGVIEGRGNFPLHPALSLAVAHGGTIDARPIPSNSITAAVNQGGRILAKPQATMTASVSNGGVITYWGDAQVTSSAQHGGAINKGAAVDADRPLSDVDTPVSCPDTPAPARPTSPKRSRTVVI